MTESPKNTKKVIKIRACDDTVLLKDGVFLRSLFGTMSGFSACIAIKHARVLELCSKDPNIMVLMETRSTRPSGCTQYGSEWMRVSEVSGNMLTLVGKPEIVGNKDYSASFQRAGQIGEYDAERMPVCEGNPYQDLMRTFSLNEMAVKVVSHVDMSTIYSALARPQSREGLMIQFGVEGLTSVEVQHLKSGDRILCYQDETIVLGTVTQCLIVLGSSVFNSQVKQSAIMVSLEVNKNGQSMSPILSNTAISPSRKPLNLGGNPIYGMCYALPKLIKGVCKSQESEDISPFADVDPLS